MDITGVVLVASERPRASFGRALAIKFVEPFKRTNPQVSPAVLVDC